jgi:hypothetical protein
MGRGRGHAADVRSAEPRVRGQAVARESMGFTVKTAEGDTVEISFASMSRARTNGVVSQSQAAYSVSVSVEGSLSDEETAQIGALMEKLVAGARSGQAVTPEDSEWSSIQSYGFAYRSSERMRATAFSALY